MIDSHQHFWNFNEAEFAHSLWLRFGVNRLNFGVNQSQSYELVVRYDVPGIHAMNFLCTEALDGGGMASLRNDPLGKGMAQVLLSMPVAVPPGWR